MEYKYYKTVGSKGRIYIPLSIRESVGIDKDTVIQITSSNGIIMINKAEVVAENPIMLLQENIKKEKEVIENKRNNIKNRIKKLLDEGKSVDEVLDEALRFLVWKEVIFMDFEKELSKYKETEKFAYDCQNLRTEHFTKYGHLIDDLTIEQKVLSEKIKELETYERGDI